MEAAKGLGGTRGELPNAWNKLASLYYQTKQYDLGEKAANQSIAEWDSDREHAAEHLATYEFLLARILSAQRRFDEAVKTGEKAIEHFAVFHSPPTEFLSHRIKELEKMRSYRDQSQTKMG